VEEREKRKIGEQLEPGGRPKAPGRLELLQRFVNTHNHDFPPDWDRLGTQPKAQTWLREKGLMAPGERISGADAARLREFREALRALIRGDAAALRTTDAQLTVAVDGAGRTSLVPSGTGADGAVATLLGILHEAQLTGEWSRMKACRQCEYAFYERSKNRSAAWCDMSICGNRTKNRTYYRRRRSTA
jgi:predicted RNA-binding Zn ribbon-like protein